MSLEKSMTVIDHAEGQPPSQMHLNYQALPKLAESEVLIKVHAFGVNRADTLQRQGRYPAPKGESRILGLEIAGEILCTGSSVSRWKTGDYVFGLVPGGGYATHVVAKSEHLLPVVSELGVVACAGIAETFLTAFQSLFWLGNLQRNSTVLIHAGASGVGLAAIQLANLMGCEIAVTASSEEKLEVCQRAGANLMINRHKECFSAYLKQRNIKADLIIDFVAGDYLNRNLDVLSLDGRIVYLAMLAGRFADKLDMALLLSKRATITGSTLRNRDNLYKAKLVKQFEKKYLKHFATGRLVPNIDFIFEAPEVAIAHQKIEMNQTVGKCIGVWPWAKY